MINPKELRIGNYILDEQGILCKVRGITEMDVRIYRGEEYDSIPRELENFNYIPLTEDWLLKFGFETVVIPQYDTNNSDGKIYGLSEFLIAKYQDKFHYTYYGSDEMGRYGNGQYDKMFIAIQYVHRLQNIYFDLKGEELTIK